MKNREKSSKPTLLLIAYDFPPRGGGGVQRPAKLCKYLSERGWRIFVLTASTEKKAIDPHLDPGPVTSERVAPLKKSVRGGSWSAILAWVPVAIAAGYRLLKEHNIDIICATLPPSPSALVAVLLHRLFGKPLVIDYRDPWTLYPDWLFDNCGKEKQDFWTQTRLRFERWLERMVLGQATGVSYAGGPDLVDDFVERFPEIKREKYHHIPNGFDSQDWQTIERREAPSEIPFHLAFLGNYYWLHVPDYFLLGLREFLNKTGIDPSAFQVSFTGAFQTGQQDLVNKLDLAPYVSISSEVKYTAALEKMLQASALLVTLPPLRPSRHWVPGKLYEYLATGKPILAVLPQGAAANLVRASGRGLVVDPNDSEGIAAALEKLISGDRCDIAVSAPDDFLAQFERRNLAERFDRLFTSCEGQITL